MKGDSRAAPAAVRRTIDTWRAARNPPQPCYQENDVSKRQRQGIESIDVSLSDSSSDRRRATRGRARISERRVVFGGISLADVSPSAGRSSEECEKQRVVCAIVSPSSRRDYSAGVYRARSISPSHSFADITTHHFACGRH